MLRNFVVLSHTHSHNTRTSHLGWDRSLRRNNTRARFTTPNSTPLKILINCFCRYFASVRFVSVMAVCPGPVCSNATQRSNGKLWGITIFTSLFGVIIFNFFVLFCFCFCFFFVSRRLNGLEHGTHEVLNRLPPKYILIYMIYCTYDFLFVSSADFIEWATARNATQPKGALKAKWWWTIIITTTTIMRSFGRLDFFLSFAFIFFFF